MDNFELYSAFERAYSNGHQETALWLLSLSPRCHSQAERHVHEHGNIVNHCLEQQLSALHTQQMVFLDERPNAVFDIGNQKQVINFYVLARHLIRRNREGDLEKLQLLLNIPAVKALAHLPSVSTPRPDNKLLRLALTTGNEEAAAILLNIPAVRELAERNNYYQDEVQGRFNLRELARSRESSMTALTLGEQKRLNAVIKLYQPRLQGQGGTPGC